MFFKGHSLRRRGRFWEFVVLKALLCGEGMVYALHTSHTFEASVLRSGSLNEDASERKTKVCSFPLLPRAWKTSVFRPVSW